MDRQQFIKLNFLAGCGLFLSGFTQALKRGGAKKKVIIIGAGAAGAMAANTLVQNGHEVVLLEARNRIGGRVNTNRDWGMNLELGANWISWASDPTNLVAGLKDKVGLETSATSYAKVKIFDSNGDKISKIGIGLTGMRAENRVYNFFENKDTSKQDISLGHAVDSLMNYQESSDAKQARLDIIKLGTAVSAGADSYNISGYGYGYGTSNTDQKDDEQLVLNGYDQVIQYLLDGIDIQLNQEVIEIEDQNTRVNVSTKNDVFSADYVIVTVPISLLQQKKIRFIPELSEAKQNSFSKMPMGLFNKVFMEFTDKFWKGNPHFLVFQKEVLKNSGIVFNYHAYSEKPILVAFHIGQSGEWVEANSETEIQKHWQETFAKAYPHQEIEFKRIMTSKWLGDPFALGSYSGIGIGTSENDVNAMAAPVGRIHFAGEATSYLGHGYVHGAMESGLREATRIMEY